MIKRKRYLTFVTLYRKTPIVFVIDRLDLGGNLQNFLSKFLRFYLTLGLKILRLLRLKVVFEADIIKR